MGHCKQRAECNVLGFFVQTTTCRVRPTLAAFCCATHFSYEVTRSAAHSATLVSSPRRLCRTSSWHCLWLCFLISHLREIDTTHTAVEVLTWKEKQVVTPKRGSERCMSNRYDVCMPNFNTFIALNQTWMSTKTTIIICLQIPNKQSKYVDKLIIICVSRSKVAGDWLSQPRKS